MRFGTVLVIILVIALNGLSYIDAISIDKKTGRLIVDDDDMKNLESSITKDKDRGGKTFQDMFKREVPRGTNYKEIKANEYSYHHIIPNNQIEQWKRTKESVEKYINEPHIKKVFLENKLATKPKKEHGKAIHASISWNPHNLVRGPCPSKRCDDPGPGIEDKLIKKQSEQYQKAIKPFVDKTGASLENFGKLPRVLPVDFELDPRTNRYKVKESPPKAVAKKPVETKKPSQPAGRRHSASWLRNFRRG